MWWFLNLFKKEKEERKTDLDVLVEYHKCLDKIEKKKYDRSPNYITSDVIKTENHEITIDYNMEPIYAIGNYTCCGINGIDVSICIDSVYINFKKRFIYNDFFIGDKIQLSERLLEYLEDEDTIKLCFECKEYKKINKQDAINVLKSINNEKILKHSYSTKKFNGMIPIGLREEKNIKNEVE